jgi:hypothetical protein
MSQLGQKRKSGDAIATSDLPLKADIKRTSREVRKVPYAVMLGILLLADRYCLEWVSFHFVQI